MSDEINMNSLVLMHYSIALTNGNVIESSFDDEPVEINMGKDEVTDGMELAIFGLKEGDSQTLTLTPVQGFGLRDEDNIHHMPLADFPEELLPKPGLTYSFESSDGEEIPGTVVSVKDKTAEIDFNHPLAGHEIIFTVNILGVNNTHTEMT
jgi:FKBP-type peptidyl-prolyl cis-trans isomerase SlpA